jgi:hypothetical protein
MLLFLNEKRGMNGGSGECDGMSVDGEAWELMLTLTNPRTWSLAMSVRTVQALEIPDAMTGTF